MDLNGIMRMAMRLFGRRLMGMVVNKGMDMALGAQKPKSEMTGEERTQSRAGRQQAKRMRQATKIGRKLW
jgi:hypothetical protein